MAKWQQFLQSQSNTKTPFKRKIAEKL
jgi:hypothetical protein